MYRTLALAAVGTLQLIALSSFASDVELTCEVLPATHLCARHHGSACESRIEISANDDEASAEVHSLPTDGTEIMLVSPFENPMKVEAFTSTGLKAERIEREGGVVLSSIDLTLQGNGEWRGVAFDGIRYEVRCEKQ